jgi:uncharacterized damage-inducible protein DinB
MTLNEIQTLYDFDRWADIKTLESIATLKPEEYTRDLHSSFGSIHGTMVHILSADRVWLNRWVGKPTAPMKAEDVPTIEVLKKQWDAHSLDLSNFLRTLTEVQLAAPFSYTDFKNNVHAQILALQMQHKVNHSTYHRGQIASMLRQLCVPPIGTDLITFYRQQGSHD